MSGRFLARATAPPSDTGVKTCCRRAGAGFAITLLVATLLLGASRAATAPAVEHKTAAGEDAVHLLQQARKNREVLSDDFPGFRSKLTVRVDGRVLHGICTFRLPGDVQVEMQAAEVPAQVTATIRSMLMHRVPSSRTSLQEARFGEKDESPLGRELLLADRNQSVYRIRDGQIIQVDRRRSEPRLVLTLLETRSTESGRYLPRHVFAVRLDQQSGSVLEAWTYISEFQRVGGEYLPKSRQVIRTHEGRTTALLIEWSEIDLLEPKAEASLPSDRSRRSRTSTEVQP